MLARSKIHADLVVTGGLVVVVRVTSQLLGKYRSEGARARLELPELAAISDARSEMSCVPRPRRYYRSDRHASALIEPAEGHYPSQDRTPRCNFKAGDAPGVDHHEPVTMSATKNT